MDRSHWNRASITALALMALGVNTAAWAANAPVEKGTLDINSPAFSAGSDIPKRFSCQGDGVSPPLAWSGVPDAAESLAIVVDDPDAPSGTWVHWVVYNLPADTARVDERAASQGLPASAGTGKNSWGDHGYGGVCPPSGRHHYHFKLYALDTRLPDKAYDKQALLETMHGHVLARGQFVATYMKQ